jgi:hypothetical protein
MRRPRVANTSSTQDAENRGHCDRRWNDTPWTRELLYGCRRNGCDERDERCCCEFLDSSPEREAVEQCRLGGNARGDSAKAHRLQGAPRECVEDESKHCCEEREVGLVHPCSVHTRELPCGPERKERADGIAVSEVDPERCLVRRRCKAREAVALLQHAVGQREERRGVVELDVTRERGLAGHHDRRGIGAEDDCSGDERWDRLVRLPSFDAAGEPCGGQTHDNRNRQRRGRRAQSRDARDHHDHRQPRGGEKRA